MKEEEWGREGGEGGGGEGGEGIEGEEEKEEGEEEREESGIILELDIRQEQWQRYTVF